MIESANLLRIFRVLLTVYIMYLLTWYYEVPQRIWCLISIWLVMLDYHTVGGVLKKGLYRLMGTFISGIYGVLIIMISHNNVILKMLAMFPLIYWYAKHYIDTNRSYIFSIGAVTLTIVLLNDNNLSVAILRIFNIILANIASIIMIIVFFPKYASDELDHQSSKLTQSLINICQYLQTKDAHVEEFFRLETRLRSEMRQLEQLIDEADTEHLFSNFDHSIYKNLIKISHQMLYLLHQIFLSKKKESDLQLIEERLKELHHGFKKGSLKKTWTHDESNQLHVHLKEYEDCIEKILLRKKQ